MPAGYCPALLKTIESIAGENAPSRKLHVAGFLAMTFCCQNSGVSPLQDSTGPDGQQSTLTVSYTQRPVLSQVQDEDDCDINNLPTKSEWGLGPWRHKQYSFFVPDSLIQLYCAEFADSVAVGRPATRVMREQYDRILEGANIVMKAINRDLVTLAGTQFGLNVVTHSTAARTINIAPTPTLDLSAGIVRLLQDFQDNEICGAPCMVGGGLMAAYEKTLAWACCNNAGLDMSRLGLPTMYFDKDSQDIWGTNQFGAFSPGSVKFISRLKYEGPYAGQKGTSIFFTMALPVNEFGCAPDCLNDLMFDVQMKYIDCPTPSTINGSATTLNRGWQFIISKDYALWVQPQTAYRIDDPLFQTNGVLRYVLTNS
jgi:hypothetical protein